VLDSNILIKDKWNNSDYKKYLEYLKSLGSKNIIQFNSKIIFTKQEIIGIKTPVLRNIAKIIAKGDIESFLLNVGSRYFEECLIEGFVIGFIKDKEVFLEFFNKFIKKVDNWATCDMCVSSFKIMKKYDFYDMAKDLSLKSDEFISRIGIIIMLDYYLDDRYIDDVLSTMLKIKSDYYYVNMAISWLISVAFVKFRSNTLNLLKLRELPVFVQNKAIQKIRDSYRVSRDDKDMLIEYKM